MQANWHNNNFLSMQFVPSEIINFAVQCHAIAIPWPVITVNRANYYDN